MFRLLSYLKQCKKSVLAIVLLLIVQAYCDLALPQYTSDIVDVGIQQGGITYAAPEWMREETWGSLQNLMTEGEKELTASCYEQAEDGTYERTTNKTADLEALNDAFRMPMVMLSAMDESAETAMNDGADAAAPTREQLQLLQALQSGSLSEEQLLSLRETITDQLGDMSDSLLNQKAILFVKEEYEALGKDPGSIQIAYLLKTGGKMLGFTLLMAVCAIAVSFLASRAAASIGKNLRGQVFGKVLSFSSGEMHRFSTASLITRSTNDIQQVQMVAVMLLRMISYAPILGIGGVLKVVGTKTGMAWIIGLAVAVIMAVVLILVSVAMPKFKLMQKLVDRMNLVSREILTGLSVIRAFSREKFEEKRFDEANRNLMKTQLFTNRVMTFMMPGMMFIMYSVTILITWVSAQKIDAGTLQVGAMTAFITYAMQIVMAFLMMTAMSIMVPRAGVAADRIDEVLKTEASVQDVKKPETLKEHKGVLEFSHVDFKYPGAEHNVLSDIDFKVEPGKTTAIIGSTGCGKSTLVNLIPRFYDVTGGVITIDGQDVRKLTLESLRSQIGLVQQDVYLFDGTIRDNIAYGKPGASDEEIIAAAKRASIHDFIMELPQQYDTYVGERGTRLSGGQKQRISIARVFLKNPPILILDEATSALDNESERWIQRSLEELSQNRTTITIAHRLSTIRDADEIIVITEDGIAERGTHEELLDMNGVYAAYYNM